MSRKIENIQQNTSTSGALEASLDHKYLKTLNNELSKEVAELRREHARKQSDIDHLLSEKFNIELKYNHLFQLFSKIEDRSRITLNHIVECSNELAYIMQITNRIKSLDDRLSEISVDTLSKSRGNSFKHVVTPHAVNGHVIHTPTIRIARYDEPTSETQPKCSENNAINQNLEEYGLSSEEEVIENDEEVLNEEDRGNRTFNSRCTISSLINSDLDYLEEDVDEVLDESPPRENGGALSPIQEDLEDSIDQDEIDGPVFSGRIEKVKVYMKQVSENMTRLNNKRGCNNSTSDLSELDTSNSSVIPEASTSDNVNEDSKFNEDDTPYTFDNISKRKSLIKRKSIGSPIPAKILRGVNNKRRSLERTYRSSASMDSYSTPRKSQEFRQSVTPTHSDTSEASETTSTNSSFKTSKGQIENTKRSVGSPIRSKILRRNNMKRLSSKRKSPSFASMDASITPRKSQELRQAIAPGHSDTREASETTLRNSSLKSPEEPIDTNMSEMDQSNAVVSTSILLPSIKSFIEKTSIHSTPSIDSSFDDVQTTITNKVNIRKKLPKKRIANPVVNVTRLSEEDLDHIGIYKKKSLKNLKRSREEKSFDEKIAVKKEKSDTKKNRIESRNMSPSSPNNLSQSNGLSTRPRRNLKPISFKEPSCNRKLRRSR